MTTWTKDQLEQAVKNSISIRQVLSALNLKPAGGNYRSIKKYIDEYGIDYSHFKGKGWNKGTTPGPKREIEEYLSNDFPITSHKLRLRLLNSGLKKPICESCGLSEWLDKPIPLELDHINGDHLDNSLANLAILCPNCHALTPTYRGKNIGKTP